MSDPTKLTKEEREMRRALMALRLEVDSSIVDDIEARFNAVLAQRAASLPTNAHTTQCSECGAGLIVQCAASSESGVREWGDDEASRLIVEFGDASQMYGRAPTPETDTRVEAALDALNAYVNRLTLAASRSVSGETPRDWTEHDHVLRWLAKDDALSTRTATLLLEVADFLGDGQMSRAPATDAEIEAAVDAYGQCCIASQVHASGTAGVAPPRIFPHEKRRELLDLIRRSRPAAATPAPSEPHEHKCFGCRGCEVCQCECGAQQNKHGVWFFATAAEYAKSGAERTTDAGTDTPTQSSGQRTGGGRDV